MARQIVLATANPAKRAQLCWLLAGLPVEPRDAPPLDVPEIALDLAGNAALKALAYSAAGLAIASDGGLELLGLPDPEPGRPSGANGLAGDAALAWDPVLTRRLGQVRLREIAAGLADRRVRWSEAAAIAEGGRLLASWTESGTEGVLAPEPWPEPSNFWVWDIFEFPALGKSWARLTPAEREQVDHTWLALRRRVQAFFAG